MRYKHALFVGVCAIVAAIGPAYGQSPDDLISPSRPVPTGGGQAFELNVNPTLEVFLTANTTALKKKPDDASGMKVIDPTQ